ncbi:hypothetical protein CC80DRAFT_475863 [Byssothecium circinans]|uniref:Zn(2)-C6 fungal-type domain-containing protein n=1 Tax=Byssothecium circinans TaxID=147558 RepID=A0A6A5TSF4_9PLEO|nr:hypothetical protein CC80DRAFT_475863 [Byssothecium circinans]
MPTCSQCARGKRVCEGYGLRLSWPRENDDRRTVILKRPQNAANYGNVHIGDVALVHASNWDIEMHMYMSSYTSKAPTLRMPFSWNPHGLKEKELDLLSYFEREASRALTTFGRDPKLLKDALMRISLSENSPASTAVLHSLLGLSSLHRYGVNEQAMQLKISSLRALAKASETCFGSAEGVHHIAAGMLLCSFEVQQASCNASEWTWYLDGIKEVLHAACFKYPLTDEDRDALLSWVQYHEVMKRFSIRHWNGGPSGLPKIMTSPSRFKDRLGKHKEISSDAFVVCQKPSASAPWIGVILASLSEICDMVPAKPCLEKMETWELDEYMNRVRILDWRIRSIHVPTVEERGSYIGAIAYLYQLSMLIYLNRVTRNVLNQDTKMQEYIGKAFTLLAGIDSCERHFPLYIIGWEARTDEQRAIVLALLEKTKKKASSRPLFLVEVMVQAVWAQDDLAEKELDYWDKVTALINCCSVLPSFV